MTSLAQEIKDLLLLSHAEGMRDGVAAALTTLTGIRDRTSLSTEGRAGYDLAVSIVEGAKAAALRNLETIEHKP